MTTGRDLRDLELDLFEQVKGTDVVARLRAYASAMYAATGTPVSMNDLRAEYERLGYAGHPSVVGAVFRRSAGWVPVGFTQATEPQQHARTIRTWVPAGVPERVAA